MAITHNEMRNSRGGKDGTRRDSTGQLKWQLRGSNDIDAMRAYIETENLAPALFDGLLFRHLSRSQKATRVWEWTAHYVDREKEEEEQLETGEYRLSFDTSGGTVRIFSSFGTTAYSSGGTPPDYKGFVQVNEKGEPEGVDVVLPALKIDLLFKHPNAIVTAAYMKTLARLTGSTNDAPFYGFAAEELLFLGANGTVTNTSDPEVGFSFLASENVTGLQIGDISGIAKGGHDFLWIRGESYKDQNYTAERPKFVYVEQVYQPRDWSALGIGDGS